MTNTPESRWSLCSDSTSMEESLTTTHGVGTWNGTRPEFKPFIDGRGDIFMYNGIFEDHVSAMRIKQPFEILDKYKIDYVFLPPEQPLSYLLEHSAAWHSIYNDKVAVLFERIPASSAVVTGSKPQSN